MQDMAERNHAFEFLDKIFHGKEDARLGRPPADHQQGGPSRIGKIESGPGNVNPAARQIDQLRIKN